MVMLRGHIPASDDLAPLLGLQEWRIGKHQPASRRSKASFWVHYLWRVVVCPSFDPPLVLAGVEADNWIDRPGSGPVWRKAVLASETEAAVVALRLDPIARALNRVPLLPPLSAAGCFDGITYAVAIYSGALEGELSFSNPDHPPLLALERSLLRLAQRVALGSGKAGLQDHVRVWRAYYREHA